MLERKIGKESNTQWSMSLYIGRISLRKMLHGSFILILRNVSLILICELEVKLLFLGVELIQAKAFMCTACDYELLKLVDSLLHGGHRVS